MSDIIGHAIKFIEQRFEGDSSGHDFHHSFRVYNLATHIAKSESVNLEIIQLSALLHDVDDRKLFGEKNIELEYTRNFMLKHKVDFLLQEKVCKVIKEVSYRGKESEKPTTIEGMIVQDADRLDAIGAIGIARVFAYGGFMGRKLHEPNDKAHMDMNAFEYYNNKGTSINHFYEKLLKLKDIMNTDEGKKIAIHRHQYMLDYLREFYAEWDGNK